MNSDESRELIRKCIVCNVETEDYIQEKEAKMWLCEKCGDNIEASKVSDDETTTESEEEEEDYDSEDFDSQDENSEDENSWDL